MLTADRGHYCTLFRLGIVRRNFIGGFHNGDLGGRRFKVKIACITCRFSFPRVEHFILLTMKTTTSTIVAEFHSETMKDFIVLTGDMAMDTNLFSTEHTSNSSMKLRVQIMMSSRVADFTGFDSGTHVLSLSCFFFGNKLNLLCF